MSNTNFGDGGGRRATGNVVFVPHPPHSPARPSMSSMASSSLSSPLHRQPVPIGDAAYETKEAVNMLDTNPPVVTAAFGDQYDEVPDPAAAAAAVPPMFGDDVENRHRLRDWQRACELATEWERWWMLRQQTSSTTSHPAIGTHRPRLKSYEGGVPVGSNPRWIVEPALARAMPPVDGDVAATAPALATISTIGTNNNGSISARDAHRQAFVEGLHRRLAIDESHIQQNDAIAAALRRDRAHRRAIQVMRSGVPHRSIPNHQSSPGNGVSNGGYHTARATRARASSSPLANNGSTGTSASPNPGRPFIRALPPPIVERSSSGGNHNHNYMPPLPTPRMPMPPYQTSPQQVTSTAATARGGDGYQYAMSHAQLEKLIAGRPLAPARAQSIQASVGGGGLGPGSYSRPAIRAVYSGRSVTSSPVRHGTFRNPVDGLYYSSSAMAAQQAATVYTPNATTRGRSPTRSHQGNKDGMHHESKNHGSPSPPSAYRSTATTSIISPVSAHSDTDHSTNGHHDNDNDNARKEEVEAEAHASSSSSTPNASSPNGAPSPSGTMTRADIPTSFPLDKLQAATPGGTLPLAILVACGSYSPVTFLHLAVLETARNYLQYQTNQYEIVGGYMSPVHDLYGKASLIPGHHRLAMVERCTQSSDWINLSSWEIEQKAWTRTAVVLKHYQQFINAAQLYDRPVRVMFLCGTDILESFSVPNLWSDDDITTILTMGLACLQRQGSDGHTIIEKTPLLHAAKDRIVIIPQRIENTISSTEVRRNLQNNATIKYLTPDPVIDYISTHSLYHAKPRSPATSPSLVSPRGTPPALAATIPASFPLNKLWHPVSAGAVDERPLCVLVACGSYSPVTYLHLAVFETARNYLQFENDMFEVVGGYMSPTHDLYGKSSLIPQHHRVEMCKRACETSEWVATSSWETEQRAWSPTATVLATYQGFLDQSKLYSRPVRTLFLCGTDVLESFLVPNLWAAADQDYILSRGVACIQRAGVDGVRLVADNPTLAKYKDNIWIIPQRITNTISSTEVRNNVRMNQTVKYLTPDNVIRYIYDNQLYGCAPRRMSTVIGFSPSTPPTALQLAKSAPLPSIPHTMSEPLSITVHHHHHGGGGTTGGISSGPASPGTGVTPSTRLRTALPVPSSFPLTKIRRLAKLSSSGLPLAVLVSCGTFSPVVHQNLAMFEAARNYLSFETKRFEVVGGILSGVHDSYAKSGADALLPSSHRAEMLRLATQTSDWLNYTTWEMEQRTWTRTASVLSTYQRFFNDAKVFDQPIRVLLLCTSEFLHSVTNTWSDDDSSLVLGRVGVVCARLPSERAPIGEDALSVDDLLKLALLKKYEENIWVMPQALPCTGSSILLRTHLSKGWSAKYMAPDNVLDYIAEHSLFPPLLTPSPSTGSITRDAPSTTAPTFTSIIAPMPVPAIATSVVKQ